MRISITRMTVAGLMKKRNLAKNARDLSVVNNAGYAAQNVKNSKLVEQKG